MNKTFKILLHYTIIYSTYVQSSWKFNYVYKLLVTPPTVIWSHFIIQNVEISKLCTYSSKFLLSKTNKSLFTKSSCYVNDNLLVTPTLDTLKVYGEKGGGYNRQNINTRLEHFALWNSSTSSLATKKVLEIQYLCECTCGGKRKFYFKP